MTENRNISERSKRVARNTFLLYFRMLVLMLIGLVTSRVILRALGIENYGIYNAVAGVVVMFTLISNSISQAISRFITFELGKGGEKLRSIFNASIWVQTALSLLLIILVNTVGLWFLFNKMNIPEGRLSDAAIVMEMALLSLVVNLYSVPFNATIIAHEKMDAFAWLSILEAALKLTVALLIWLFPADGLILYAVLMAVVAIIVRFAYALYCRRHFEEARGRLKLPEAGIFSELAGFAGWNFLGSSSFVINTQGMNLLTNVFFGVGANAARGVAAQVDSMVKQFATNLITAINPQITKSYASGDRDYCFTLVTKASRYTFLILLLFAVPFAFEADYLLELWLVNVPEHSADFVRLTIIGIMADVVFNPLLTLELAYGKIRNYYIATGIVAYLALPLSWALFRFTDAPVSSPYIVFAVTYLTVGIIRLIFVHRQMNFPVRAFIRELLLRCGAVCVIALSLTYAVNSLLGGSVSEVLRLICVLGTSCIAIAISSWFLVLTEGEKSFIIDRIQSLFKGKAL